MLLALRPIKMIVALNGFKTFSTNIPLQKKFKVVIAGSAGGIGQSMSMLLKYNELISELALYDIAKVNPGVACDLSHVDTPTCVSSYMEEDGLVKAVKNSHVVVIAAGVTGKPGMSRDDLFSTNVNIVVEITRIVARHAPNTILAIITNPVNSLVPVACEILKNECVFDERRVFGVTTLDVVRASTFVSEINGMDPQDINIPVVGGHSGNTIVPLLSACKPCLLCSAQEIEKLTKRIQEAGTEVVKAKDGGGSATLSMAYAGARFVASILKGLSGESNVVECAYVNSNITPVEYFANPVSLGTNGMEHNLGFTCSNCYEQYLVGIAINELGNNIRTGQRFVKDILSEKK